MDLFTTKIRLKDSADKEKVLAVLKTWLKGSPHYKIKEIDYDGKELFKQDFENTSISILNSNISYNTILALRFVNREDKNSWITDCIYSEINDEKNISITLSCHTKNYSRSLPKIHKPHIIKNLIEADLCYDKGVFPIVDKPIYLKDADVEICAQIMCGTVKTNLPVVYLSVDGFNPNLYSVDENKLASSLSGIAHVLVEPNKTFSKKLKELTNSNNPYNGYIGIYFSNSTYKEIISIEDFFENGKLDSKQMASFVRATLQQSVLNHDNTNDYSWSNLQVLYHRKNFEEESKSATDTKQECDALLAAFDEDVKKKEEKIKDLQYQLDYKNSIIESFKSKKEIDNTISFKTTGITEFYHGELNDLIITLLSQLQPKLNADTRQKDILDVFLEENELLGEGKEILNNIENALKDKSLQLRRSKLEKCGFTLETGSHDKMYFHEPKYSFTLANSPSEHRSVDNMFSDIKKAISIYKKIV